MQNGTKRDATAESGLVSELSGCRLGPSLLQLLMFDRRTSAAPETWRSVTAAADVRFTLNRSYPASLNNEQLVGDGTRGH